MRILRHFFLHRIRPSPFESLLLFVLVFGFSTYLQAQNTGSVTVHVTDLNEQGIMQAEVRLAIFGHESGSYYGFTDGTGTYNFGGVEHGTYYVQVKKVGYETGTDRIDVAAGLSHFVPIRMKSLDENPGRNNAPGPAISAYALTIPAGARKAYDKGMAALREHPEESILQFRKAIASHPNFAEAYAMLALAYLAQRNPKDAADALNKAIEINPKLGMAQTMLGKVYLQDKDYARAEERLRQGAELDPSAWNAHYELARCYFGQGKFERALTSALTARDLPESPSRVHLLLVDIYSKQNDKQNALKELQVFAKQDPHSPMMPRVQAAMDQLRQQP
jgi:Tfp pilus assembly protein PilF